MALRTGTAAGPSPEYTTASQPRRSSAADSASAPVTASACTVQPAASRACRIVPRRAGATSASRILSEATTTTVIGPAREGLTGRGGARLARQAAARSSVSSRRPPLIPQSCNRAAKLRISRTTAVFSTKVMASKRRMPTARAASASARDERAAHALPLLRVGDRDGELGDVAPGLEPHAAGHAQQPLRLTYGHGGQGEMVALVHVREVAQLGPREARLRAEEPVPDGLRAEALHQRGQRRLVVRPEGADAVGGSVGERGKHGESGESWITLSDDALPRRIPSVRGAREPRAPRYRCDIGTYSRSRSPV